MLLCPHLHYVIVMSEDLNQKIWLYSWKITLVAVTVSNTLVFGYYIYKVSFIFVIKKRLQALFLD